MKDLNAHTLAQANTLQDAVFEVRKAANFRAHPYFVWIDDPAITREEFVASQVPFRHAVEQFSRALAATMARIPEVERRMAVADNVAEEHGRGRADQAHSATFREYLLSLGASPAQLAAPCPIAVDAFVASVVAHCLTHNGEEGAATTGMIEDLYVGISGHIASTIVERGWVEPGSQRHYALHEDLDVVHARDLFAVAATGWDGPHRERIARSLLLGARWFWTLYDGLLP